MVSLDYLAQYLDGKVVGDKAFQISNLAPLSQALEHHLSFLANPKYLSQLLSSQAGAVLIAPAHFNQLKQPYQHQYLVVANPYACFAKVAQLLIDLASQPKKAGIDPSAVVDPRAKIAASAIIGPQVVIEADADIGEHVQIDAQAFIGQNVKIAAHSHLFPRVVVYHDCQIGQRVTIHAGAVIGADGFGFAPDFVEENGVKTGDWVKIPQVGRVVIEEDVDIGANTTIDRGAMDDTRIERGVKIDNLVQIAHNCKIGAFTVIAACTGIAGSAVIGQHCMIGGAVGIAGHLTLADGVIVTAKSGVSKSLSKPGMYSSAFPAVEHLQWNKSAALLRNLGKLRDRVQALERAVTLIDDESQSC